MNVLLGSGRIYNLLAEKINTNYPKELIQISPKYAGTTFDGCLSTWHQFKDEVDEARFLLNNLPEVKEKIFTHIYFCIPDVEARHPDKIQWSFDFVDLLKEHVLSYVYLLNSLVSYPTKLYLFNELDSEDFEVQLLQQCLRPLVMTAIAGTKSQLIYHTAKTFNINDFGN